MHYLSIYAQYLQETLKYIGWYFVVDKYNIS